MDRGNKLWDGHRFLLPVRRNKSWAEKPAPIPRPILDEQHLLRMDQTLQEAIDSGFQVRIKVYDPRRIRIYEGCVRGVAARRLVVETDRGLVQIPMSDVLEIEI